MADKAISELVAASEVAGTDLFVLEQAGTAKKLSGQTLTTFLLQLIDGHGGIVSIEKTSTSGLVDTYTITMADLSTTAFPVTNGAKGDKGDNTYVWIKYSSAQPTKDSDIYDTPDNYMGIYAGNDSTAPTAYTAYSWFQIKGEKGDTGSAASLLSQSVRYQASTSGTVVPSGAWLDAVPVVTQGQYLWTQSTMQFNTGEAQVAYSVSRFGMDGSGSVATVNSISPDDTGNVSLTVEDIDAVPTSRQVNKKELSEDITLTAADVGAVPTTGLLDKVYPVGAIYMSANATSPASLFGGTWTQIKDRFVLAAGDIYAAGSTGGAATHTLLADEMPGHTHGVLINFQGGSSWDMYSVNPVTNYDPSTNGAIMGTTTAVGGGAAHNNMPPYLAVYMWQRVA